MDDDWVAREHSLLLRTPALKALSDLAKGMIAADVRLIHILPDMLALELFHFLQVKRHLAASELAAALQVSPGPLVDALWHRMLLQSDVREAVDALLGGHVPHSLRDADELSDGDKLARRLTAMNLMALAGWPPNPRFWREAGTLMHEVVAVSAGGVTVHVAPRMSRNAAYTVTRKFLEQMRFGGSGAAALAAALAAVAPPRPAAPPVNGGDDGRKRQRAAGDAAREGDAGGGRMHVIVREQSGAACEIRLPRRGALVAHLMVAVTQRQCGPMLGHFYLVHDGMRLDPYAELAEYYIEPGEHIDLVYDQSGC